MFDDLHDPHPPHLGSEHLADIATRADHRRRRRTLRWTGAASAVLVAGSITALVLRNPDDRVPSSRPIVTVTDSSPTATPATVGTEVPGATDESEAERAELDEFLATIGDLARDVPSFSAHVVRTIEEPGAEPLHIESDVVMQADGSTWATRSDGGWTSYDPATAVVRTAGRPAADADLIYQEIGGQDSDGGESRVLGFSPVVRSLDGSSVTIATGTMDELDDRPVWLVELHAEYQMSGGSDSELQSDDYVYTIDQATGLTVAYERTETIPQSDGSTLIRRSTSRLTSFEVGTPLPTEFPGHFPEHAAVERFSAPNVFAGDMTEGELTEAFGSGLLVPDLEADRPLMQLLASPPNLSGSPAEEPGSVDSVIFVWKRGFDRIRGDLDRVTEHGPVVGGELGLVSGGALDGLPIYQPEPNGSYLVQATIDGQLLNVQIDSRSVEEAAELLATFRRPEPGEQDGAG